jgi:hypothetical protein
MQRGTLLALVVGVGCGASPSGMGLPAPDAGLADGAPFFDSRPAADARSVDAPLAADASIAIDAPLAIDAPPAAADARPGDAPGAADAAPAADAGCGPLELDFAGDFVEHSAVATTDVAAAVSGTGPFTCSFYNGLAAGTRPSGAALTGCALSGGAGPNQPPGQYGFIVVVADGCGHTVEVPVALNNGPCDSLVTFAPAPWPPRVPANPIAGYGWSLSLELDLVGDGMGSCGYCYEMQMSTRAPGQISGNLDCANPGMICSDCDDCVETITTCSGNVTMQRDVTVKAHERLRPAGAPAWLTVEMGLLWSGSSTQPCGGKEWTCHLDSLEL